MSIAETTRPLLLPLESLIERIQPDLVVLDRARARQRAAATPEGADYLPLILWAPVEEFPPVGDWLVPTVYNYAEQVGDPRKMLYEQLRNVLSHCRARSDGVPFVAPRYGIGTLPSVFGLEQIIQEDAPPWIAAHLDKEAARRLTVPDELHRAGLMPQVLEFIAMARELLPPSIPVGAYFMLSPIDIAFMVRGEAIMMDMYEDPEFVHGLLDVCTELFVRAFHMLKSACGEPLEEGVYDNGLHMSRGGVIGCEDCAVMLSSELHRKFSLPYNRRALEAFGGGWVHFCGQGGHLMPDYLCEEQIRGFLFGQLDLYDRPAICRQIVESGKGLLYNIPRAPNEPLSNYFARVLEPMAGLPRRGMLFEGWHVQQHELPTGMELWHAAQDRFWG